jgi:hypothetical protein
MPDGVNFNHSRLVLNLVDDAVVADPKAPQGRGPPQQPAPRRSRCLSEPFDTGKNSPGDTWRQPLQFLSGRAREAKLEFTHEPVAVDGDGDGP